MGDPRHPTGIVTFTWNSTSVADGSHTLSVKSYLSGSGAANASQTITVVVNNHASGGGSSTSAHCHRELRCLAMQPVHL